MLGKFLLYPFSILYDLVTSWRNKLYDTSQKKSVSFDVPVVNVGNLTVGGTGKTPHVTMLAEVFTKLFDYKVAVLSRGYGRKTKGYHLANKKITSSEIGDEPLQIFQAFQGRVPVAVCEERLVGIPFLLQDFPEIDLIILDDAFQHRKVRPRLNVLLCDYNRPFYKDFLLPAGRLRESRKGAKRADVVVVTKTPESLDKHEMGEIKASIKRYTQAPVFFSKYKYLPPRNFAGKEIVSINRVVLVTGIANTHYLLSYIKHKYHLQKHFEFADHIKFTDKHIKQIKTYFDSVPKEGTVVLTTEKDKVKLNELLSKEEDIPFYFLPIKCEIIEDEEKFTSFLKKGVE